MPIEGELYKRIKKQFLSNRWSQPFDLYPILDEAKKDLKSKETFGKFILESGLSEDADFEKVRFFNYWVEKWFGNE